MSKLLRHLGPLAAGTVMAVFVACSGMDQPATPGAAETRAGAPTRASTTEYDSTANMYLLYTGRGHSSSDSREAIALAVANNDKSMVPVIIEALRFFRNRDVLDETQEALSAITGQEFTGPLRGWNKWMEWLGRNADEYDPPDGYLEWKIKYSIKIDRRYGEFLAPAEQGSRIRIVEIAWGGVRPDGIPDLQNPSVVLADQQDYLLPSDRVFGVSINGEHRAYPLRIANAHEMVNDTVGGEPIALAY